MSLILDALRKMELERKARRSSSHELRSEVLNYRGTTPSFERPGIFRVTALFLVASAAVAVIFYFARPKPQKNVPVKIAEPLTQEQPVVPQPPTPAQLPSSQPLPEKSPAPDNRAVKEAQELATKTLKGVQKSSEEAIAVSGIAWQEERHLRRAVINGALVGEGAEILGAKVVEIRENRVRFSRGGEIFEIVHSSGPGR